MTAPYFAPITIQGLSALADHDVGCSSNCVYRHERLLSVTSATGSSCPSARLVLPTRRRALLPFPTYMLLARCQQHSMSTFAGRLTLAKAQESKVDPFELPSVKCTASCSPGALLAEQTRSHRGSCWPSRSQVQLSFGQLAPARAPLQQSWSPETELSRRSTLWVGSRTCLF